MRAAGSGKTTVTRTKSPGNQGPGVSNKTKSPQRKASPKGATITTTTSTNKNGAGAGARSNFNSAASKTSGTTGGSGSAQTKAVGSKKKSTSSASGGAFAPSSFSITPQARPYKKPATMKRSGKASQHSQQSTKQKATKLNDLWIETYDHAVGRPSLLDINNLQVWEGNEDPDILTPQLGQDQAYTYTQSLSNTDPLGSQMQQDQQKQLISSGSASMGNVSDENNFSGKNTGKFKKKSDIDEQALTHMLEQKARISINTKTGKHEFKYGNPSIHKNAQYFENSDSLVKIQDSSSGVHEQLMPIRPSKVIWQMPYEERKSFMNEANNQTTLNNQLQRISQLNQPFQKKNQNQGGLIIKKQRSNEFQKASNSDSDFEYVDEDFIDGEEEFGGASRSVRFSIRALNFNMMITQQNNSFGVGDNRPSGQRASLLSRASSLVAQNNQNRRSTRDSRPSAVANNFDRSSKLLMGYLNPNMQSSKNQSNRDSCFYMTGIDEREELDDDGNSLYGPNGGNSTRPSNVAKKYNFQNFYTPSQPSKRVQLDYSRQPGLFQSHTVTNSVQQSDRKAQLLSSVESKNARKYTLQDMENSIIPERDNEDSQAVDDEESSQFAQSANMDEIKLEHQLIGEVSGRYSQKLSILEKDDEFGSSSGPQAADEGYSRGTKQTEDDFLQDSGGRNSLPTGELQQQKYQEVMAQPAGARHHTKHSSKYSVNNLPKNVSQSQAHSVQQLGHAQYMQSQTGDEEQTVERFIAETGASQPASFVNNFDKTDLVNRKNLNQEIESNDDSLQILPENSGTSEKQADYKDLSVQYYDPQENDLADDVEEIPKRGNQPSNNIDSFQNNDDVGPNEYLDNDDDDRQIGIKTTERNPMLMDSENTPGNTLNQFVTKVPQQDNEDPDNQQDLHKQHFVQTVQALQFIKNNIRVVDDEEMQDLCVDLPPPRNPNQKKLVIFDMDETLIHCVDDIETQDPDVILEIDFPDEETVYAGINIRPYIMECLEEANKHFQVIVFTASHQIYADAILDYIDPNHEYIEHRLYRQHCFLTSEGYYVKDLRIFGDRDLKDVVIVDNSVYSFAFQIDNGIPIIPFYNDKADEEMLHLVYYLNCLGGVEDVRDQNRQAFELFKLSNDEQGVDAEGDQPLDMNDQEEQGFPYEADENELDENEEHTEQQQYSNPYGGESVQQHQDNGHDITIQSNLMNNSNLTASQNYYQASVNQEDIIHEESKEDQSQYNGAYDDPRESRNSRSQITSQISGVSMVSGLSGSQVSASNHDLSAIQQMNFGGQNHYSIHGGTGIMSRPSAPDSINEENSMQHRSRPESQYALQNLNRISDVSGLIDGYEAQQLQSDPDQILCSPGTDFHNEFNSNLRSQGGSRGLQEQHLQNNHLQQDMYYSASQDGRQNQYGEENENASPKSLYR